MYRTFLPSEPKKSEKSKEKLSDATLRSGRHTGYVDIDVDATVDVLAKALTLFVYRSKEPVFFKESPSAEGGLRIEKNKTCFFCKKRIHEARQEENGNNLFPNMFDNKNDRDVWEQVIFLHRGLLLKLMGNKASDESSVTKILDRQRESIRHSAWTERDQTIYGAPNKRVTTTLVGPSSNGWSECEAALFVLCVKDAATMDNKLDFWLINARSDSLKKMKTKDGKTITVWSTHT